MDQNNLSALDKAKLRLDAFCQMPAFVFGGCTCCFVLMAAFMAFLIMGPLVHKYVDEMSDGLAWAIAAGAGVGFLLLSAVLVVCVFYSIKLLKKKWPNFGNDQDASFILSSAEADVDYI